MIDFRFLALESTGKHIDFHREADGPCSGDAYVGLLDAQSATLRVAGFGPSPFS
jgi:hypothetical protein